MSMPTDRRSRKRLATRQSISDAATRLFLERGFDRVTIDEIATAADVGRMTVFNHFARKEDLLFDREPEIRDAVCAAVRRREPGVGPIEALRRFAHRSIAERTRYLRFGPETRSFVATVEGSETLMARARAIRDEIAGDLAAALADAAARPGDDPDAQLAAALLLATWTTAVVRAHQTFRATNDARAAEAAFLAVVDRGTTAATAAMAQTPYASERSGPLSQRQRTSGE